jgi:ribosomal protein L17
MVIDRVSFVPQGQDRAMLRNLAAGLFEHGQITTTMPKAKAGSMSSTAHRLIAAKPCSRSLARGAVTTLSRGSRPKLQLFSFVQRQSRFPNVQSNSMHARPSDGHAKWWTVFRTRL